VGGAGRETLTTVLFLLQNPIIVDVGKQPDATGDISIDFVVGMFAMAGVLLLAATIGSLIVAAVVFMIKRRQAASGSDGSTSHTQLKI
jgi:hypothetical protein